MQAAKPKSKRPRQGRGRGQDGGGLRCSDDDNHICHRGRGWQVIRLNPTPFSADHSHVIFTASSAVVLFITAVRPPT